MTVPLLADDRVRRGERLAGLVAIPASLPLGRALDDLLLLLECGAPADFEGQVWRLPLRAG